MDNITNEIQMNNQVETNNVNESVVEIAPKDKYMADGKMSPWEIILTIRYFLPLITTIGFVLSLMFEPKAGDFLDTLTMIFAYIGWVAAITVSPIKILKFIWCSIAACFKVARGFIPVYGVADLVAGIVGLGVGLTFSLAVLAFVPAAFTIPKFFKN